MTDPLNPFWTSILSPYIDQSRPRSILLAGGGDGTLLMQVLNLVLASGGLLHVADPAPAFDTKAARQHGGDSLVLHPAPGREVAALLAAPDLLLLNGDANFYSATSVLHAVQDQADRQDRPYPMTIAGNTTWPYGRRDHYPDPQAVPDIHRHPSKQAGLRPDQAELCHSGGLFADRIHATRESDPGNGVLTALEEFVSSQSPKLGLASLPVWHGLGVIYALADRSEATAALLAAIAMGEAARHEVEKAELARWTLEAELAERRLAGAASQQHIDKLTEALRREQIRAAELRPRAVPELALAAGARIAGRLASLAANRLRSPRATPAENADAPDIARLRSSAVMNGAWYLQQYGDVAESGVDPAVHYYKDGAREGRDPGPDFSTSFYLARYPDVAEAGHNPLLHYLRSGAAEGRNPSPHFDSAHYLAANPDVAEAGHNPLEHYLASGRAEGRAPLPPR